MYMHSFGPSVIQHAAHVDSRLPVPLEAGDVVTCRFDTAHGIQVSEGCLFSVVVWFRGKDPKTAPWLEREAEAGDSDAQALLGRVFSQGDLGRARDDAEAVRWLELASSQDHPDAQHALGLLIAGDRRGGGGAASESVAGHAGAEACWRAAALQGHSRAQRLLGELLLGGQGAGRQGEGVHWLREAAQQGDADAAFQLSEVLSEGEAREPQQAAAYLEEAARGGHVAAQRALGFRLLPGGGDRGAQALQHLTSAAQGGDVESQLFLAGMMRQSPKTEALSMHWLFQAARHGAASAQRDMGHLLLERASSEPDPGGASVLAAIGRAWLGVAGARGDAGVAGSVARARPREAARGCPVAECLELLLERGAPRWVAGGGAEASFLQRVLLDVTEQVVNGQAGSSRVPSPSFHLCMDLMQVHHWHDCLFRWGNNWGTADFPRACTHSGDGGLPEDRDAVVACKAWRGAASADRRQIAEEAFAKLCAQGYVVLEELLPADLVQPLEAQFLEMSGTCTEDLRAGRSQTALPFEAPWSDSWLVCNELVLELVARYICNNDALACEGKEEQAWAFVRWVAGGATTEYYTDAPTEARARPSFGAIDVIHTPGHRMPQLRHRDTNLPGICASLTVNVPLTPLTPRNGPIGFVPRTHVLEAPSVEVQACPPLGSVILYDSFLEHRGCENSTDRSRSVLSMTFDPGVWMRSFDPAYGGQTAWEHHSAFRRKIGQRLEAITAEARGEQPRPDGALADSSRERRVGRCSGSPQCRASAAEQQLELDRATGEWVCERCFDQRLYVDRPRAEGSVDKVGLQPYLGLAAW
ncbi:unnamed protein product [Prorocentrum cordatum]|uniref:Uncharacterized protein n=1 Tax=Prorocentrum cordatum TaxID=2364126 RepID=A0ABN9WQG8_9DINO|nr:unnamed protein product [Polarella glacialis]